jgi:hypothetical protein
MPYEEVYQIAIKEETNYQSFEEFWGGEILQGKQEQMLFDEMDQEANPDWIANKDSFMFSLDTAESTFDVANQICVRTIVWESKEIKDLYYKLIWNHVTNGTSVFPAKYDRLIRQTLSDSDLPYDNA